MLTDDGHAEKQYTPLKHCFVGGITTVLSSLSVNLTTLFLGRLPKQLTSTKWITSFRQYLTNALLESAEWREWP